MVATSDTGTFSLSYRISCASCAAQSGNAPTVVPIVPRTPPPHHPASYGGPALSFSFSFADLRSDFDRLRSESLDCARYAGVGDHSPACKTQIRLLMFEII